MAPRNRVKGEIYQISNLYRWEGDGFATVYSGPLWNSSTLRHETMLDYPGKTGSGKGSGGVRPVSHRTWIYDGLPYQDWRGDNFRLHSLQNVVYPLELQSIYSSLPELSEGSYQALLLDAFNEFSTQFPAEISFAEFAGGLLEIKSLIPKFSGDLVKDLASLHLTNQFGWQSLVGDLAKFGTLLKTVEDRLAWLRSTRGKPTRLGFSRFNITEAATGPDSDLDYEPVRSWGVRYRRTAFRRDFRAGATLLHKLDHLNDAFGYLRSISGALGLFNPVLSFWETLPFSFVVDYFLNISARLDQLTRLQPVEPWDLLKVTNSVSTYAQWDVYQVNNNTEFGPADEAQTRKLGVLKMWDYVRGTGLPIEIASFSLSDLNSDQLTLLGCLFTAGSHR